MALSSLIGARLNCLKLAGTRSTKASYRGVRMVSLVPPVRPFQKTNTFVLQQYSQNYWWSSSKPNLPLSQPVLSSPPTPAPMVLEQPPLALDETTQDIANAVPSVSPPPLEFGDFSELGLLSWTPAGFIRWTIEVIQVTTGMPWFHTIICATVLWRIVLVPISIKTLQNSARLLPMSNRLLAIKDEMAIAQKQRDKLALQRIMLKQQKIYSDAGVSMGPMIIAPFVQLPVTLGLFFGIKKICQLPLEQLKNSGLDILPDLTMADPYFILPTIAAIVINVQISVGAKEMNLVERPQMGHLMNLLRVVSITGIYFMGDLPSGLMISLITGVAATTLQSLALQYQPLRRWLDIPVVLPQHRGRLPSFKQSIDFVVKSVKEKQLEANRQAARQRRQ